MEIKLLDYDGNQGFVEVGDIDQIKSMDITILSGDEVLAVEYKDGIIAGYDSSEGRTMDFFDGAYRIYDYREKDNLLFDKKFINRKSSYWKREW